MKNQTRQVPLHFILRCNMGTSVNYSTSEKNWFHVFFRRI